MCCMLRWMLLGGQVGLGIVKCPLLRFYLILLYFILFYFILFYFILSYFILFISFYFYWVIGELSFTKCIQLGLLVSLLT